MSEAVTPGPNFDWKREAEHYRYQCDQLRELLREVEEIGDQLDAASNAERDALRAELAALRAERDDWRTKALDVEHHPVVSRMRAELGGFMVALEQIAEGNCSNCHDIKPEEDFREIARAALAGGKETG